MYLYYKSFCSFFYFFWNYIKAIDGVSFALAIMASQHPLSFSILLHLKEDHLFDYVLGECSWVEVLNVLVCAKCMSAVLYRVVQERFPHLQQTRRIVMLAIEEHLQSRLATHHFFPRLFEMLYKQITEKNFLQTKLLSTNPFSFSIVTLTESLKYLTFRKNRITIHFFKTKRSKRLLLKISLCEIDKKMEQLFNISALHPGRLQLVQSRTPWKQILDQVR
jgi:hypothetical protein